MARQDIEKAQSMINTLEAQRNQAFNQVAQMQVLLDDNAAEIAELAAQISANDDEIDGDGKTLEAKKKAAK